MKRPAWSWVGPIILVALTFGCSSPAPIAKARVTISKPLDAPAIRALLDRMESGHKLSDLDTKDLIKTATGGEYLTDVQALIVLSRAVQLKQFELDDLKFVIQNKVITEDESGVFTFLQIYASALGIGPPSSAEFDTIKSKLADERPAKLTQKERGFVEARTQPKQTSGLAMVGWVILSRPSLEVGDQAWFEKRITSQRAHYEAKQVQFYDFVLQCMKLKFESPSP